MPRISDMTDVELQQAVDALAECGNQTAAAAKLRLSRTTLQGRLRTADLKGIRAKVGSLKTAPALKTAPIEFRIALLNLIKKTPVSLDEIVSQLGCTKGQAVDGIEALTLEGNQLALLGERWTISANPSPAFMRNAIPTYYSRPDGTYLFGACGDNHLGSKYARLDVLESLYDWYAEEGVDRVFNTGNWIDGEARFNKHDLVVHGMDNQLRHLAKFYPQRKGIVTYAVSGDDHEGWYAQSMGIDIGRRAQQTMRENGRNDWVDLGYMEAHIKLVHSQSGASSILAVVHPGGGSSYATSYSIQKIIESLDGGEKPAVGIYGHYHKLWSGNIRNVWVMQTGTTEDQTTFMRKKKLEAHVGGGLIKLTQDPETGAIYRFRPEFQRWFNKGHYNNRWNLGDDVQHAERAVA